MEGDNDTVGHDDTDGNDVGISGESEGHKLGLKDVGISVSSTKTGAFVGTTDSLKRKAVGDNEGREEGNEGGAVGLKVGLTLGETVGLLVGTLVGVSVGLWVGSAEGSYVGSGVNLCMQRVHAVTRFCNPETKVYTVSPVVCSVSASTHWSSWVIKLADPCLRSKALSPVESAKLVLVPITPNTPGGVA